MKLFDLHCDTATECFNSEQSLSALSLPFAHNPYEQWTQVMAFFLHDNRKEGAWDYFLSAYAFYKKDMKISCPGFSDYGSGQPFTLMAAIENAGYLCDDLTQVDTLSDMGIRMMSLCWNGDNPLCGGSNGVNIGLTQQGHQILKRMEKNKMVLDVSHASDATFADVCRATDRPFVATHSNCRALCGHKRNLTDEQIREIITRGGLIGINFYKAFLHETETEKPYELIIRHMDRILNLGGEKVLAIGSDFDGADIADELKQNLCGLYEAVCDSFGVQTADRIFYDNSANFFPSYR